MKSYRRLESGVVVLFLCASLTHASGSLVWNLYCWLFFVIINSLFSLISIIYLSLPWVPLRERCAQALSQYLSPTLALFKLEKQSEEKEILLPDSDWPGSSFKNQEERDAAQPSTSIQEASTRERGAIVIQSKLRVDSQGQRGWRG